MTRDTCLAGAGLHRHGDGVGPAVRLPAVRGHRVQGRGDRDRGVENLTQPAAYSFTMNDSVIGYC